VILEIIPEAAKDMYSLGGFFLHPVRCRHWKKLSMADKESQKRNFNRAFENICI
jgi:hypothetical protein